MTTPCRCSAYPFPHRQGGGHCERRTVDRGAPNDKTIEEMNAAESRYIDRENAREINRRYG